MVLATESIFRLRYSSGFFLGWDMCTFVVSVNGNSWLGSVYFCSVSKWQYLAWTCVLL